jgi:predicted PurR-regulated permease PerM
MKLQFDKESFRISLYAFFTLAALILFFKVVDNFSSAFDSFRIIIDFVFGLFRPFIIGIIIAYFLYRPIKWIEERFFNYKIKRKKLCRVISILTIYIIIFVILGGFLSFTIPRIGKNITDLIIGIPEYIEDTGEFLTELDINKRIQNFIDSLPIDSQAIRNYNFVGNIDSYINDLLDNAQSTLEQIVIYLVNSVISFTSGFFSLIVSLFIAFYILKDKEELFLSFYKYFNTFHPKKVKRWREVLYITDEIFGKYLLGNIIDSTIIGILCFIGLLLMNIRFALLISIIIGITNLIPFFGPFIGAVPGVIITLFDSPIKALWLVLFILVLQQFDGNYLKPKVLGERVGLNPFWVLFAIIIGGGMFGILGMFLGVPTIAVIRVLILQAIEKESHHPITK